jgi:hypothetical protein
MLLRVPLGGYLESSTSLLLALLLLGSATVTGIADVRLLPKRARRDTT